MPWEPIILLSNKILTSTDNNNKIGWSHYSWLFLVFAIAFIGLAIFLWILTVRYSRYKPDENLLQQYSWLRRWFTKNRLILAMIGAAFCSLIGIFLLLQSFGIIIPITNNLE